MAGATAEEIVQQYPSVAPADVYSVIAYYLRHRADLETYLADRQREAAKVGEEVERRFDLFGIRERLLARRRQPAEPVLRLAADENFNNDIFRGLIRRNPDIDIVSVQDAVQNSRRRKKLSSIEEIALSVVGLYSITSVPPDGTPPTCAS